MASICTVPLADLKREVEAPKNAAYLVQIRPTGTNLGARHELQKEPVVLGRSEDCGICTRDGSTSRRHARIDPAGDGTYRVLDLQSTNGTYVNDVQVSNAPLRDGDYLRLGQVVYRFLMPSNVEVAYHEELQQLSTTDPLTLIPNRRGLECAAVQEMARASRLGRPLALLLFDVDGFKGINDQLGHTAGDAALRELAARVEASLRRGDIFGRLGGDEFAILLPSTSLEAAGVVAERIRQAVAKKPFQHDDKSFDITISTGAAAVQPNQEIPFERFMEIADANLYRAKQAGRNRVCTSK